VRTVIALVVLALAAPVGAEAGQKVLSLQWSELPGQIGGKNVRAALTDGSRLEGRATSVGAESLVIDVKKSSDPARLNNAASVRRAELAVLEVRKSGWVWKVAAPILGFVSFGFAGAAIGNQIDPQGFIISDGAVNGAVAGIVTGIGAGLVVGWLADRHYVRIMVVP
jgi:hypothetical protein